MDDARTAATVITNTQEEGKSRFRLTILVFLFCFFVNFCFVFLFCVLFDLIFVPSFVFFLIQFDWISTVWFPRKEMEGKEKEKEKKVMNFMFQFGLVLLLACGKRNELDICVQLC